MVRRRPSIVAEVQRMARHGSRSGENPSTSGCGRLTLIGGRENLLLRRRVVCSVHAYSHHAMSSRYLHNSYIILASLGICQVLRPSARRPILAAIRTLVGNTTARQSRHGEAKFSRIAAMPFLCSESVVRASRATHVSRLLPRNHGRLSGKRPTLTCLVSGVPEAESSLNGTILLQPRRY
jgi:hypothetical protein